MGRVKKNFSEKYNSPFANAVRDDVCRYIREKMEEVPTCTH